MIRISRYFRPTLLGTALPLLLALVLPAAAKAECGDYVRIGDGHRPMTDPARPAPGLPCTGPGCSQRPLPLTPPTAPARLTLTGDDWGCPVAVADPLPAPRAGWLDLANSCSPVWLPSDIFHPPRAGSV